MPIGTSLGVTLPTQGGNTGTWGTDLNTEINKIITAVEAQVPVTAIDVSADFDFNSFAATDVAHVSYVEVTAPVELRTTYVDSTGNLFYRDGANNAIQLTASGGLNNAGAGGLGDSGGDYGTGGISFDWDGTRYNALNGSGSDDYANVRMGFLELRDGSASTLTVDVPTMGSDYTLTLPAAVPVAAAFVQMDTSGNLTASNTITGTIAVTGGVTATGDVTTDQLHHGTRIKQIHASAANGSATYNTTSRIYQLGNSERIQFDLGLNVGDRILSATLLCTSAGTGNTTFFIGYKRTTLGSITTVATSTNAAPLAASVSLGSINYTITDGDAMFADFNTDGVTTANVLLLKLSYDHP